MLKRMTRVMPLGSTENDVILDAKMGYGSVLSPQMNAIFINTADKGSSGSGPAVRTGTNWRAGSMVYFRNTATLTGFTGGPGSTGSPGSTGPTGNQGTGGAGGRGASDGGTPSSLAGSAGGPGSTGGTGGTGGVGGTGITGGSAFANDITAPMGVKIVVHNGSGTFTGGSGGPGGPAGPGGPGGPGGLGGGGGGGGGGFT